mgnify:CR=1 FL=1
MDEKVYQTLKSAETEDWLDLHIVRPFCYWWAVFFAELNIHPNTVTIFSMFIGAGSAFFFAWGSYYYEGTQGLWMNIIAILLLCLADIFDCTDGQLARMTGKKSKLGRILDGAAGFTWFVPIYFAIVFRFYQHHDIEFSWLGLDPNNTQYVWILTAIVLVLAFISGIFGISGQQRLADYYIQAHLFFLKGEKGSELDNSKQQQDIYDQMTSETPWYERSFQKSYIDYTRKQEIQTPEFQRLLNVMKERYGSLDNIPQNLRDEFHRYSLPVIKWNGLLTFNFRSLWLFLFCLTDIPAVYFLWEIFAMGLLTWYVNHRHEAFCKLLRENMER